MQTLYAHIKQNSNAVSLPWIEDADERDRWETEVAGGNLVGALEAYRGKLGLSANPHPRVLSDGSIILKVTKTFPQINAEFNGWLADPTCCITILKMSMDAEACRAYIKEVDPDGATDPRFRGGA